MKITDVRSWIIRTPDPSWGGSQWYFLKLETDEGITGWGEVALLGALREIDAGFHSTVAGIAHRHLIGRNPLAIEALWHDVFSGSMLKHPDFVRGGFLSGFDQALWDINGKAHGAPIHQLLGGKVRDRVRTYSYIYDRPGRTDREYVGRWHDLWLQPEIVASRAAEMVEEGFDALKYDPIPGGTPLDPRNLSLEDLDRAEESCRRIREAVGNRCDILIGTHGQTTTASAIRLAKRLEPYDPLWFEEPVPPANRREMAKVARATTIPVATGERLATLYEFQELLVAGGADIVQPDLGSCGGISQCKKIAALAEAHYAQVAPHVWGGPLITAAALQIDACIPNFLIQESIYRSGDFFDELLDEPMDWSEGYLTVPHRPGLGVNLREEALEEHQVR